MKNLKKVASAALAVAVLFGAGGLFTGVADAAWKAPVYKSTPAPAPRPAPAPAPKPAPPKPAPAPAKPPVSTYKPPAPTPKPPSVPAPAVQLTQQLGSTSGFNSNQKVDIQKAINSGILAGVGNNNNTVSASLNDAATGSQAAAFLLRSVGVTTSDTSAGMAAQMKQYLPNADPNKPISAADLNKLAANIAASNKGASNLAAFQPSAVAQLASGGLTRGDLLLLATSPATPAPAAPKPTPVASTPSYSAPSYSAPSYSAPSYSSPSYSSYTPPRPSPVYSAPAPVYVPAPKPKVVVTPSVTQLQDTPAEFKVNKSAKASVQSGRSYGSNVKDVLRSARDNGTLQLDFSDKYNNWASKLFQH